ncbi:hypothetical protein [Tepidibacter sp. Z1-5]|uniref:hypothetical protein n=1 Tax=Tepidibacter sp. Z1-5 TaxID=3134138 RepID=UPI0030C069B0
MLNISNRKQYTYLLKHSITKCTEFILVVVPEIELNTNGAKVLDRLKPYLKEKKKGYEWPGTQRFEDGDPVTIYHYSLNEHSINILLQSADSLYSWVQPNLPEDLCFIKEDGSVWVYTSSHEEMSWVEDESDEELNFIENINNLAK